MVLSCFISKYTKKFFSFFQLLKKNKDYFWSEEYEHAFYSIKGYMGKASLLENPLIKEIVYLYLAFTNMMANDVLIADRKEK